MKLLTVTLSLVIVLTSCMTRAKINDGDITNELTLADSIDLKLENHNIEQVLLDDIQEQKLIDSIDIIDPQFSTLYIVVVDSSRDYHSLNKKMYQISNEFKILVDTMNRSYDPIKDLIVLPNDDIDEMYAGDYFPRRYVSNWLSLEYLYFYNEESYDNTIGLIAGIYNSKNLADSLLQIIKFSEKQSFVLKGNVFVGCMH